MGKIFDDLNLNPYQSQYVPIPDSIGQTGLAIQQQANTNKASENSLLNELIKVPTLPIDAPKKQAIINKYQADVDDMLKKSGGRWSQLDGLVQQHARKLTEDMSTGPLATYNQQYNSYKESNKLWEEANKAGKYNGSEDIAHHAMLDSPLNAYNKAGGVQYDPSGRHQNVFKAGNVGGYPDMEKELGELAKGWKANQTIGGITKGGDGQYYVQGTTKQVTFDEVNNALMKDVEVNPKYAGWKKDAEAYYTAQGYDGKSHVQHILGGIITPVANREAFKEDENTWHEDGLGRDRSKWQLENTMPNIETADEASQTANPIGNSVKTVKDSIGKYAQDQMKTYNDLITEAAMATKSDPKQMAGKYTMDYILNGGKIPGISQEELSKKVDEINNSKHMSSVASQLDTEAEQSAIDKVGRNRWDAVHKEMSSLPTLQGVSKEEALKTVDVWSSLREVPVKNGTPRTVATIEGKEINLTPEQALHIQNIVRQPEFKKYQEASSDMSTVVKDKESAKEDYLSHKGNSQSSSWSQTAMPAYKQVRTKDGSIQTIPDEEGSTKNTKVVNDFFQKPENLRGLKFSTVKGEGTFDELVKDQLGVDKNIKPKELQIGTVRLTKTPSIGAERAFVIPVSYKGQSIEMKVPVSQIRTEGIQQAINNPTEKANQIYEQGALYGLNEYKDIPKLPGVQIHYNSPQPIIINGTAYSKERGLYYIADALKNK